MKILNVSFVQCLIVTAALFTSPLQIRAATSTTASGQSGGSSWPREKYSNGTRLIIYQPQVGASQPAGSAGSNRSTADEPSAYDDIRDCGAPSTSRSSSSMVLVRWARLL